MDKDGQQRWRMRQRLSVAFTEDHRLDSAENCGECYGKSDQEKWGRPGLFPHRGCENEKFTGEHAKGWHAENGERPQHQSPANGWAESYQTTNAIHLLCPGGLRGMTGGEKDGRLGERVNRHVQQCCEIGHRATQSK